MNPDTASEWQKSLGWWEKGSAETTKISPSQSDLSRAQELLEGLLKGVPHAHFWRGLTTQDWKPGLLAGMAQFCTSNPISRAQEPNRKVLPPFEVCLQMLNGPSSPEVQDLVYLILQKAEHALNPTQRDKLQAHFEQAAGQTPLSELATRTAERLNFRVSGVGSGGTTVA
jgi:hypothetical protein